MAAIDLALAYMRRKRWEAKLQAVAIVNELGAALQGEEKHKQMSLGSLGMMGFRIEGANG